MQKLGPYAKAVESPQPPDLAVEALITLLKFSTDYDGEMFDWAKLAEVRRELSDY